MKRHSGHILISPRVTEKAAYLGEVGVYAFNVAKDATKKQIADAVKEIYQVTPRKVTLVAIPRKRVMTRGANRMGMTAGGKKAYVHLKKGENIELA